jgi:hydrogenase maturation factor
MTGSMDAPECIPVDGRCHICADEAIVGRVLAIDAGQRTATVALPTGPATVALDLVEAAVGDDLLVHLGFAIERVAR